MSKRRESDRVIRMRKGKTLGWNRRGVVEGGEN
jgi:hypothetical protein